MTEVDTRSTRTRTDVWSKLGSNSGVSIPLEQLAVEYAWFFGGVIAPFDSAGKRIGSLLTATAGAEGGAPGTTQQTIGPDGCPTTAPSNTMRSGSDESDTVGCPWTFRWPSRTRRPRWRSSGRCRTSAGPTARSAATRTATPTAPASSRAAEQLPINLLQGDAPVTGTFRVVRWMSKISLSQAQPSEI